MWYIWLIAAVAFIALEVMTVCFLVFWLGIACIFAMVVSFFTYSVIIQTAVFVISSAILIPLTKPFVDKFTKKDSVPTNSYSLINKKGIVLKDINALEGVGLIKVNGETWSAKSEDGSTILKDSEVEVLAIDGVKLIVKQI